MPEIEAIIAVTLAGFALSATPGPSMLYVLSRSVGQSRAAGLASALGLGLGGILLAVATALGLAAIFERLDWLVVGLRYAGSIYLIWLGIGIIKDARTNAKLNLEVGRVEQKSFFGIVWQGVLVELLNPKTVLFFALFLPPFVAVGGQDFEVDIQLQLLILGSLIPLTAIPSDIIVAFLGGTMARAINQQQSLREYMGLTGGIILICIAISLHL